MKRSIWILGDQLSRRHPGLAGANRERDCVVFIESRKCGRHQRDHQQKLVLIYSAMRHFAGELRADGWQVDYYEMGADESFESALHQHVGKFCPEEVLLMEPNSYFENALVADACRSVERPLVVLPSVQFLTPRSDFIDWARGKNRLLMETHYRRLRVEHGILVDDQGKPEGGAWNFDAENRKTFANWKSSGATRPPALRKARQDEITKQVIQDVTRSFPDAPGSADGFWLPVTREEALDWLQIGFVKMRLGSYGDFQDLMVEDERTLFHSLLSPMINIGLLDPMECIQAAVTAWRTGSAPLAAVEGFVRQILGWREFVNGVYWLKMPGYTDENSLNATRPLPEFFYTGKTGMNCLRSAIGQVIDTGYNHHIQRLMVLGNFLLLAGVRPQEALRWFTEMYVDAHDWVMAANVIGMALHADGGFMATKPYAGAGAYISKMSNYCRGCQYKPTEKLGPSACPFNLLYWSFYDRHQERFARNPRTSMMVKSWRTRSAADREAILREAQTFLDQISPDTAASTSA